MTDPSVPDDVPGLQWPGTPEALKRYLLTSSRSLVCGLVALVIGAVVVLGADGNPQGVANAVALGCLGLGAVACCVGLVGIVRAVRARRLLARAPWVVRTCWYRIAPIGGNGQPALLIEADDHGPESVCSVSATALRFRRLPQGPHQPMLVGGDPLRWAVVAAVNPRVVIIIKRPWIPWWRRRLRRWALGGLANPPA